MVSRGAVAVLVAAVASSGCDTGFRPETLVADLRVLGVRATPAELRPGEIARLEVLALDPSRPGAATTVVWIGCEADPFNQNRGACSDPAVLQDLSQLLGAELPPGVKLIGFGRNAFYAVPPTLFDVPDLPEGQRTVGTVGQALAIVVAEEVSPAASQDELQAVFARAKSGEVKSVVTLFRLKVSENPERNSNPELSRLLVGGEPLPSGAHVQVLPGEKVGLDVEAAESSYEVFTASTPTSGAELSTERLLAAWYSTSGRFSEERTALGESVKTVFTAPASKADPVPEDRSGTLWVVLRDTRGGQAWRDFPFYVCDASLPEPIITAVRSTPPPVVGISVEGEHLEAVLDVVVDGRAFAGSYLTAHAAWEGVLSSPVPAGEHELTIFTRACKRFVAQQRYVAP